MATSANQVVRASRCGVRILAGSLASCVLWLAPQAPAQAGSPPDVPAPVCVGTPDMPCEGYVADPSLVPSTVPQHHAPGVNAMFLQELQHTLDSMTTPNPATMQKIRETQKQGALSRQNDEVAMQNAEVMRQHQAQRNAESARQQQLRDLSSRLQLMPGASGAPVVLGSGGTNFFGQGPAVPGSAANAGGEDLESLRAGASSGFDTPGKIAGGPLAPPPEPPPPARLERGERPLPPRDQLAPELRTLVEERDGLRARKQEMEESIHRLETLRTPTPEDSAALARLRQDLAVSINQEKYLTFTINEQLP